MSYSPNFRGSASKAGSRRLETNYQNGSVSVLSQGTPVYTNASGQILPVNPADETSVESMVGFTLYAIPSGASGAVISGGRLENISIPFGIGETLWINYDGTLTNVKPDLSKTGWAEGYFVIFVGVVVPNEFNATQKDLQLCKEVVGQL